VEYREQSTRALTFGLGEVSLLDTRLESFVELGIDEGDLVVGLDVFLERLTAVVDEESVYGYPHVVMRP